MGSLDARKELAAGEHQNSAVRDGEASADQGGTVNRRGTEEKEEVSAFAPFRAGVWLAGLFLLCVGYFAPHIDSNQTARIDMAVAIVDHGTFAIDAYQANTADKDLYNGSYYSNKAPGSSLLAVPVYLLYKGVLTVHGGIPADTANDPRLGHLVAFTASALPSALFLLIFFWSLGYFSSSLVNRTVLTLALGLGTIVFPYAQNYFAHVTVAGLLFAAFVLIYIGGGPDTIRGAWSRRLADNPAAAAYLAGFILGTAILFEYPPAIIALIIGVYALIRLPWQAFPALVLGPVPPLLMLLAYNWAVFQNPFTLSYASGTDVTNNASFAHGIAGFQLPSPASWWGMSFSPFRGPFFLSPFLLLACPGFVLWERRGGREWLVCLSISVAFFLVISMFLDWSAGFSVGPRYIIPLLPFLALPTIFTLDWITSGRVTREVMGIVYGLVCVLVCISVINVWGETISSIAIAWPDLTNMNPLFSADLPNLLMGGVIANLGTMGFGLSGTGSLVLLMALLLMWTAGVCVLSFLMRFKRQSAPITSAEGTSEAVQSRL